MKNTLKYSEALDLLASLIQTPSISKEEENTARIIQEFLSTKGIVFHTSDNNVWATNQYFKAGKPSILLNSHHDTVKPNAGYTKDPFKAIIQDDKLYGLGSNDAGASLVSLLFTFMNFYAQENLPFNLIYAATAEEEISGKKGIASIINQFGGIELGIVGEPTEMKLAVAEKGLMVLDCYSKGAAGHAARNEGINAIYKALKDIEWFQKYIFEEESELLGPVHMSVTMIEAGSQHNVVPASCHFVVDVRGTDAYSNEEIVEIINDNTDCEVIPRSTRLQPSSLPMNHLMSEVASELGIEKYGSPTLSDQALMPFTTCKIGPGSSSRSHMADEFIYLWELDQGIDGYMQLLMKYFEKN